MREARGVAIAGALVCLLAFATLAGPPDAGAGRHIPGGCNDRVRVAGLWTPPLLGPMTIRQSVGGCRPAKRLIRRIAKGACLLPTGVSCLPYPADRSKWRCRWVRNSDVPYVDCQRHRGGLLQEVSFRLSPPLGVGLVVDVDGCAAEGIAGFAPGYGYPLHPPVTYSIDYGGPGRHESGASSRLRNPWVYDHPGTYTVTATAKDSHGRTATARDTATVTQGADVPCDL